MFTICPQFSMDTFRASGIPLTILSEAGPISGMSNSPTITSVGTDISFRRVIWDTSNQIAIAEVLVTDLNRVDGLCRETDFSWMASQFNGCIVSTLRNAPLQPDGYTPRSPFGSYRRLYCGGALEGYGTTTCPVDNIEFNSRMH